MCELNEMAAAEPNPDCVSLNVVQVVVLLIVIFVMWIFWT
jgi:hypothetical protein